MYLSKYRHDNYSPNLVPMANNPGSGSPPIRASYTHQIVSWKYDLFYEDIFKCFHVFTVNDPNMTQLFILNMKLLLIYLAQIMYRILTRQWIISLFGTVTNKHYTDALSPETVQSKFASIISSVANVSDRNSTDINVHVNDFVKSVDDVLLHCFGRILNRLLIINISILLKMTGIMIIVKIKREFLIMPLMILERIIQMKIDIYL